MHAGPALSMRSTPHRHRRRKCGGRSRSVGAPLWSVPAIGTMSKLGLGTGMQQQRATSLGCHEGLIRLRNVNCANVPKCSRYTGMYVQPAGPWPHLQRLKRREGLQLQRKQPPFLGQWDKPGSEASESGVSEAYCRCVKPLPNNHSWTTERITLRTVPDTSKAAAPSSDHTK